MWSPSGMGFNWVNSMGDNLKIGALGINNFKLRKCCHSGKEAVIWGCFDPHLNLQVIRKNIWSNYSIIREKKWVQAVANESEKQRPWKLFHFCRFHAFYFVEKLIVLSPTWWMRRKWRCTRLWKIHRVEIRYTRNSYRGAMHVTNEMK